MDEVQLNEMILDAEWFDRTADTFVCVRRRTVKNLRDADTEIRRCWAEIEELRSSLEDMCYQFAYWSKGRNGRMTGGLSALENAFDVLGWDDPHTTEEIGENKEASDGGA